MRRGTSLLLAILLANPAAAGPRIVSINPCIDAVLVRVADPAQIAGISHYSHDPRSSSTPLALARRFKATSGTAEEVVALAPDLVLAGDHVDPATIAALRRMNIRLLRFGVPATIGESMAQVRAIAAAAGQSARGEALAGRIARAVTAARPADGRAVPALIRLGDGLVPGADTLADGLLRAAGFTNMSAAYGLNQWDVLPLEYLAARPPAVLLTESAAPLHPVVKRLARYIAVRPFPAQLMQCGGLNIVEALGRLKAIRDALRSTQTDRRGAGS